MRVLVHDPARCTGCGACEAACAEKWFKERDRDKSAIQIVEAPGSAQRYRAIICTQCGDCIDVCPSLAISRAKSGVVVIHKALCVRCLACVGFCDIWAMRAHDDVDTPFKCVACGACVEACPEDALHIEQVEAPTPSQTARWLERKTV
jgi:Fe-S-cluster-containing dehydrogenase component